MNNLFINSVEVTGGFWKKYQKTAVENIIPYQEKAIKDQIEGIEPSHAVDNFINAGKKLAGAKDYTDFYGMVFQDSDVAKWIEAASFSLAKYPDEKLAARIDELIELVSKAQESDGYLDTYFTLKRPDQKWKNLHDAHELYCAGHFIEAGVAHYEVTGKTNLFKIVCKLADCIYEHFITQKHEGYPGHPEIELALLKLSRSSGNTKYAELAKHFIDVRGVDPDFYTKEMQKRDWNVWGSESVDPRYHQCHLPVREQTTAEGHAVRAGYLFTAMADLAFETKDAELLAACRRLWQNITQKRMYVTGGIGSTNQGEAFTVDYDLPNDTAYSETCAAISLMMFARQMLRNEKLGEYGDIMEQSLYNTVLAGMQLDGRRFFYVNPLEAIPGISGVAVTHRHALPQRPGWYGCACCPPNVARTISDIADYAWQLDGTTLFSVLFASCKLELPDYGIKITEKTEYPYDGRITFEIEKTDSAKAGSAAVETLAVRLPKWAKGAKWQFECDAQVKDGFVYFDLSKFNGAPVAGQPVKLTIEIDLHLEPRKIWCSNFKPPYAAKLV
ncbi:MAG: glycoside hydrolase family 127 protein, partial [Spirochaetaceae bacterium]|nr:glycoside hydrolase family 127 protein [Spirochaetaceae bacterium]